MRDRCTTFKVREKYRTLRERKERKEGRKEKEEGKKSRDSEDRGKMERRNERFRRCFRVNGHELKGAARRFEYRNDSQIGGSMETISRQWRMEKSR